MARSFSGQRLRESRKAAGVSVERLALTIGRSAYSIQEYQRGRVTPPVHVIAAIADTLGCTVDDLLDEEAAANAA
ncbi:helix-turn-helix transcriptional regulator [Streptomyces scabiei]|uniref:helix-turn-helix domain-containing protein n=1 Tax=Streptomyces scabiei TaxID=1930 RepID=UPI00298FE877|nr:helix-turn-helix transcriptional regulator [Streptomyces scabiei]MDW8807743.1 helix-turn-helix transcriptional regulator [Streptomyces scabiei]